MMGEVLTRRRNNALCALYVEFISVVAGFSFYFARKNSISLMANVVCLFSAFFGYYGALKLKKWQLSIHSVITVGVIGIVWLYLAMEALFREELRYQSQNHSSEVFVLFLFTLPYLVDTITGIVTFRLAYDLFKEDELKEKQAKISKDESEPILAH
mmetsp:Transcript_12902/g.11025  ORF Transcript_12902/g.11025 Transcript_12902/m.11025 type:complete len:156 (+) Transcript_12902:265-732(+)